MIRKEKDREQYKDKGEERSGSIGEEVGVESGCCREDKGERKAEGR